MRSGSVSTCSSRSSSPTRSSSSHSDKFVRSGRVRVIRSDSNGNQLHKQDTYTGTISVVVRPKPLLTRDRDNWFINDNSIISNADAGEFKFDRVFPADCSNLDVYEKTSRPMIDKLLQGFNATVFAYGMTGSGKTFTMAGTEQELGLIPLSVAYLFSRLMEESLNGNTRYEVIVSYLEIYNERIYDLLDCEAENKIHTTPSRMFASGASRSNNGAVELKIREDSKYGVRIAGLTEKRCESSEELLSWIQIGDGSRKTGETIYNTRSSRSHAIVLIRLTSTNIQDGVSVSSTLSLCDLAGSERAVGQNERRKEGAFINKSLLALGTVISKLSAESLARNSALLSSSGSSSSSNSGGGGGGATNCSNHIPYRDSKLTRILQPALSGNSIVTTICTIDTRSEATPETINTMRFASRAKNVALNVVRRPTVTATDSSEDKDRLIEKLTQQLEEQHRIMSNLKRADSQGCGSETNDNCDDTIIDPNSTLLQTENKVLKYKLDHCEKLLDKDSIELEDSEMVAIVDMLPVEVGTLLETKFQGLESQLRQYKEYTNQLEVELIGIKKRQQYLSEQTDFNKSTCDEYVVRGKDMEISELQRSLERKDKMIQALQSAKRLRERALKPINSDDIKRFVEEKDKYF